MWAGVAKAAAPDLGLTEAPHLLDQVLVMLVGVVWKGKRRVGPSPHHPRVEHARQHLAVRHLGLGFQLLRDGAMRRGEEPGNDGGRHERHGQPRHHHH